MNHKYQLFASFGEGGKEEEDPSSSCLNWAFKSSSAVFMIPINMVYVLCIELFRGLPLTFNSSLIHLIHKTYFIINNSFSCI